MWRKDEPRAPSLPAQKAITVNTQTSPSNQPTSSGSLFISPQTACLTRLVTVEGDITGQDDLVIDGQVHGKIRISGGKLTIGPEGRVTAEVEAREVVVRGEVKGNVKGHDRVRIAATGKVMGDINTKSIAIEEGADVHGVRVNLDKDEWLRTASSAETVSRPDGKAQLPLREESSRVHV
jgi:cytoskeletal protein CcmA (bactofilin family)